MMLAVFALALLSLVLAWTRLRRTGLVALFATFVLATLLFLWEVYSPDYGFRMPWLQGERTPALVATRT
jgi:hypothetical protein